MEKLWDVVIYEIATGKVDSIIGNGMRRSAGFHNAEKRLETALNRINGGYYAEIVPAGEYQVGDVVK